MFNFARKYYLSNNLAINETQTNNKFDMPFTKNRYANFLGESVFIPPSVK
ncbi:hypothetical protein [Flavobacterium piscis]|nr:hypothetical protein [Flavobacterium piscis]